MSEPYPTGLTRRQREIVDVVRYRNAAPGSPCFVLPDAGFGNVALYVPVLYGRPDSPDGPLHERLWRVKHGSVKAAIDSGAVEIGPARRSDGLRGIPTGRMVAPLTVGPWRAIAAHPAGGVQ